jgi:hypothetical protein
MSSDHIPPVMSLQMLIDAGLNGFGLQLFVESIAALAEKSGGKFEPFTFSFRGILFSWAPDPNNPLDGRHH